MHWGGLGFFGFIWSLVLLSAVGQLVDAFSLTKGKAWGEVQGGICDDSGGLLDCSVKATFRV